VRVETVADGVHLVRGSAVNWVIVVDGDAVTLVDGGYPRDAAALVASLGAVGHRPEQVEAVLLTHAHVDHVGGVAPLVARHGTPVLTSEIEARHARREFLEQATPAAVAARVWRPRVLAWAAVAARAGALRAVVLPAARGVATGVALDLPGRPVGVATPGHTSGHTAWLLPGAGVACVGDALGTAHPTSTRVGPQVLDPMFHHDRAAVPAALDALAALDADVVAPGHGPAWHGPIADAVRRAREGGG
jgi:glyoxylase-like metal-dependent hydrolase (beta-lactamase superfamily II)